MLCLKKKSSSISSTQSINFQKQTNKQLTKNQVIIEIVSDKAF